MTNELITRGADFDTEHWKLQLEQDPHMKSAHTKRGYIADLLNFETWRNCRPAGKLLVEQYAAQLQAEGLSPATINRKLAAVRWYARRLADMAQDDTSIGDPERRLMIDRAERIASVENVNGTRPQKGRHIAPGELAALMAACEDDPTPAGRRDAALIALAWSTGLRRDELSGLTLEVWHPLAEDPYLTVKGKGDKSRDAYVYNGSHAALIDWLQLRGSDPGRVFCQVTKAGNILPRKAIGGEALRLVLEKRRAAAAVAPLIWHDFRRTFAGNLLDNGQDLVTVTTVQITAQSGAVELR